MIDTIPFHFAMIAVDLLLWIGLYFWMFFGIKRPRRTNLTDLMPEIDRPHRTSRSLCWDLAGVVGFGFAGLFALGVVAKLFRTNLGQCLVEGLTFHAGFFLFVSAVFLLMNRRRVFGILSVLLGLLILGLGIDMLYIEPYNLTVEHYTVETTKLRKPLRLVFVADIQTNNIGDYERRTLETIREQKADLIILGGDYLQVPERSPKEAELTEQFARLLEDVALSAPYGVYAIHGNLDPSSGERFSKLFQYTDPIEEYFETTLLEALGADQGLEPIDLILLSVNDSVQGRGDDVFLDDGRFLIVAGHYPNYAIRDYRHSEKTPDLMLAGHTHGGQFALPFYGPVRVKRTGREEIITREFLRGMKNFSNGGKLLISRGSGMERGWAPRIRFLCSPEISVIDIVPSKETIP